MSMSCHNFACSAFDPAGTITVGKLPRVFWVQSLPIGGLSGTIPPPRVAAASHHARRYRPPSLQL
jgi:hypothetical protein